MARITSDGGTSDGGTSDGGTSVDDTGGAGDGGTSDGGTSDGSETSNNLSFSEGMGMGMGMGMGTDDGLEWLDLLWLASPPPMSKTSPPQHGDSGIIIPDIDPSKMLDLSPIDFQCLQWEEMLWLQVPLDRPDELPDCFDPANC